VHTIVIIYYWSRNELIHGLYTFNHNVLILDNIGTTYIHISTSIINNYNCVHKLRHQDVCIKMHLKKYSIKFHLNSRIKLLSFYILNSNSQMTPFIGYINNSVIKFLIYLNSHMRIVWQINDIISVQFHVFIQDRGTFVLSYCHFIFWIHFDFSSLNKRNAEQNDE
jgi:hypothetical protein